MCFGYSTKLRGLFKTVKIAALARVEKYMQLAFCLCKWFCPPLEELLWALMVNFLLFIVVWIGWVRSKDLLAAAG